MTLWAKHRSVALVTKLIELHVSSIALADRPCRVLIVVGKVITGNKVTELELF